MVVSVTFFSLMDILVKVTDDYAVGQILFFRALFGFIPIIFLIPKNRLRDFYKTKRWSLHFYRSIFGAIAMAAIFIALRNLQLAEVTAMTFAGPLFVTLLSIFFLNEKVGRKRWIAVGLGFVGLSLASVLASKEYTVIGIDKDKKKCSEIRSGRVPVYEPDLEKTLKIGLRKSLKISDDFKRFSFASFNSRQIR